MKNMKSHINTDTALRIIITIILTTAAIGLILALTSCRATSRITDREHTQRSIHTDSAAAIDIHAARRLWRRTHTTRDTALIRDTVIVRDTVNVTRTSDTTTITKTHWRDRIITRWRDRDTSHTDTILRIDTIIQISDHTTADTHSDTDTVTQTKVTANPPGIRYLRIALGILSAIAVITIARIIRTRLKM